MISVRWMIFLGFQSHPKSDLMAQPERFRLQFHGIPNISVEEQTTHGVIYTTGSTSRPTPFYDTSHDHFSGISQMKAACEIGGLRSSDVGMNLFPLTSIPHQGFLSALWGPLSVGARVAAGLTGRAYQPFSAHNTLDRAVDFIEEHQATIRWGISTYVDPA